MTELKYKVGDAVLVEAVIGVIDTKDGNLPYYAKVEASKYLWLSEGAIFSLSNRRQTKQTDGLQLTLGDLELLCRASDALKLPEEKQDAFGGLYNKITEYIDASQNAVLERKITVGV